MELILSPEMKKAKYKKTLQDLYERDRTHEKAMAQLNEDHKNIQAKRKEWEGEFSKFCVSVLGKSTEDKELTFNVLEVMRVLND